MIKIGKDKFLHFGICALVAFVSVIALSACVRIEHFVSGNCEYCKSACILGGFLCGVYLGVGKEYGDKVNPYDGWDWYDLLADILGSFIGSLVALFLL